MVSHHEYSLQKFWEQKAQEEYPYISFWKVLAVKASGEWKFLQ